MSASGCRLTSARTPLRAFARIFNDLSSMGDTDRAWPQPRVDLQDSPPQLSRGPSITACLHRPARRSALYRTSRSVRSGRRKSRQHRVHSCGHVSHNTSSTAICSRSKHLSGVGCGLFNRDLERYFRQIYTPAQYVLFKFIRRYGEVSRSSVAFDVTEDRTDVS